MRPDIVSTLVLAVVAVVLAVIAYARDPGLPLIGIRNGAGMLWFILPRLVPAIIIAGLLQVLVPQETVQRYFGRDSGLRALCVASLAGVLTPGGPMVTVPFMVALAHSGAAMAPLAVRVVPSLAFPVLAGWLVKIFYQE